MSSFLVFELKFHELKYHLNHVGINTNLQVFKPLTTNVPHQIETNKLI